VSRIDPLFCFEIKTLLSVRAKLTITLYERNRPDLQDLRVAPVHSVRRLPFTTLKPPSGGFFFDSLISDYGSLTLLKGKWAARAVRR
jgi:hypothetical protein